MEPARLQQITELRCATVVVRYISTILYHESKNVAIRYFIELEKMVVVFCITVAAQCNLK